VAIQVAEQLLFQVAVVRVGRDALEVFDDVVRDLLRGLLRVLDDAVAGHVHAAPRRDADRDRHADGDEPDFRPDGHGGKAILP
jgi:hypothetical protein